MTENKECRGLLDFMATEIENANVDLISPASEFVPGIGLGATQDASRWARIGRAIEMGAKIPEPTKRGVGQPPKKPKFSNDAKRAFVLYMTAQRIRHESELPNDAKIEYPLTSLIEIAKETVPTRNLFDKPKSENKMYASVKRGKDILGIDKWWRGPEPGSLFIIE